nr:MAG TPA: hypothetical protein [Caudoviricetes sp.]
MKKTEVKGIITAHETKALRNNAKASVTAVNKAKREYLEQNYGMQHMEALRSKVAETVDLIQSMGLDDEPIYGSKVIDLAKLGHLRWQNVEAFTEYFMDHMATRYYDDVKAIEYRYAARRKEIIEEYEKLYSILKTNTADETYDYIINTVGMDPSLTDYKAPEKFEIAPTAVRSDLLGVD